MIRILPCLFATAGFVLGASQVEAQTFTVRRGQWPGFHRQGHLLLPGGRCRFHHPIPSWGKTGDESSLTISFNGDNKFRLLPNSEAQVTTGDTSDSSSAWHRVVSLTIGKATFDHNAGGTPVVHLDCQTPTAVCGAVGTEYAVDATTGNYSVCRADTFPSRPTRKAS